MSAYNALTDVVGLRDFLRNAIFGDRTTVEILNDPSISEPYRKLLLDLDVNFQSKDAHARVLEALKGDDEMGVQIRTTLRERWPSFLLSRVMYEQAIK